MSDLVKRLRLVTGFIRFETGDRIAAAACLSEEAADALTAQAAEIERLRGAVEKAAEYHAEDAKEHEANRDYIAAEYHRTREQFYRAALNKEPTQ